jgi:hypothetical protein
VHGQDLVFRRHVLVQYLIVLYYLLDPSVHPPKVPRSLAPTICPSSVYPANHPAHHPTDHPALHLIVLYCLLDRSAHPLKYLARSFPRFLHTTPTTAAAAASLPCSLAPLLLAPSPLVSLLPSYLSPPALLLSLPSLLLPTLPPLSHYCCRCSPCFRKTPTDNAPRPVCPTNYPTDYPAGHPANRPTDFPNTAVQ